MCNRSHSQAAPRPRAGFGVERLRCLAALPVLLVSLLAAGQEEEKMTIMLSSPESKDYLTLEPDVKPLRQGDAASFAPAAPKAPAGTAAYTAYCGDNERNGRVGATLPKGDWVLAWEREIRQGQLPEAVLSAGDRILVQTGVWQLFDTEGNLVKEGSSGFGAATLDPAHGLFYHINRSADVVARNLSDGTQVYALMPFLSEQFARPLIQRMPRRLLVIGIERQLDPHGHRAADRSLMEWIDLGDTPDVSTSGLLRSARNAGTLILPTAALLAAAGDGAVVCASPGRIYVCAAEPRLEAVYGGEFDPLRLSLGGNGIIYLAVLEGDEVFLWCVSMSGELLKRSAFPEGAGSPVAPPLVGFDNRIYLATANRVIALSAKAEPLWEWRSDSLVIGATCTADGTLAVTSERELGLLSADGKYSPIQRSVDAPYCTAPCVTEEGHIVVASPGIVRAFHCP